MFAANTARLRDLLVRVVAALPLERECPCGSALDGTSVSLELP